MNKTQPLVGLLLLFASLPLWGADPRDLVTADAGLRFSGASSELDYLTGFGTPFDFHPTLELSRSFEGAGLGIMAELYYRDRFGIEVSYDHNFLKGLNGNLVGYTLQIKTLDRLEIGLGGAQFMTNIGPVFVDVSGLLARVGVAFYQSERWKGSFFAEGFYGPDDSSMRYAKNVQFGFCFARVLPREKG